MREITIVGGGLAGLVAAIEAAEGGAQVVLHEASGRLGGRARTLERSGYRTNLGPHALYTDGPAWAWLEARGLTPATVEPVIRRFRARRRGRLARFPWPLVVAFRRLREPAPDDVDLRTWATARAGAAAAEAAIGFLSLPTFDHDPGRLSAAFGRDLLQRLARRGTVRYVVGGWSHLVDALAARAVALGVRVELRSRIGEPPDGPVIVATSAPAAAALLGDAAVAPAPRPVALLDVGLDRAPRLAAVLDLDERVYVSRSSASDPSLAPRGHELLQASAPMRPGEDLDAAVGRIEEVMDAGFPGWRAHLAWRAVARAGLGGGAVDLPGRSWTDRPAVERGGAVFLAGDYVAAPGLLSEVSFVSASRAAAGALAAAARGRAAVGR